MLQLQVVGRGGGAAGEDYRFLYGSQSAPNIRWYMSASQVYKEVWLVKARTEPSSKQLNSVEACKLPAYVGEHLTGGHLKST